MHSPSTPAQRHGHSRRLGIQTLRHQTAVRVEYIRSASARRCRRRCRRRPPCILSRQSFDRPHTYTADVVLPATRTSSPPHCPLHTSTRYPRESVVSPRFEGFAGPPDHPPTRDQLTACKTGQTRHSKHSPSDRRRPSGPAPSLRSTSLGRRGRPSSSPVDRPRRLRGSRVAQGRRGKRKTQARNKSSRRRRRSVPESFYPFKDMFTRDCASCSIPAHT
ncbi:hypothetical protein PENSPDRAFT_210816 [Peniophora sp. CONT]|nr:hypothetical protein PENSPDRAFT_210816 [Peniophora sp. CONT]